MHRANTSFWLTGSLTAVLISPVYCLDTSTAASAQLNKEAKRLTEQNRLKEALVIERRALALDPENALALGGLAAIYSRLGQNGEALTAVKAALHVAPDDARLNYLMAQILQRLGEGEAAIASYKQSMALHARSPNVQIALASALAQVGRIRDAVLELERLKKDYPLDKRVWVALAQAYLAYHDSFGADAAAIRAFQIDPNYYPAVKLKAEMDERMLRQKEARDLAEKLLEIDPKNKDGYLFAAELALRDYNNLPLASRTLQKAVFNLPGEARLFQQLGRMCLLKGAELDRQRADRPYARKLKKQWWSLAEEALRRSASISPENVEVEIDLANLLLSEKKGEQALCFACKAQRLLPADPAVESLYRRCLAFQNDLSAAFKDWLWRLIDKKPPLFQG